MRHRVREDIKRYKLPVRQSRDITPSPGRTMPDESLTLLPLSSHYRSRSLKMKKVLALRKRLRKSGYREGRRASATAQLLATAQLRRNAKVLALRKRLRKSGYREGRKASATAQLLTTAQPLTDRQTDTIYSGSELQSTHGRPTRILSGQGPGLVNVLSLLSGLQP